MDRADKWPAGPEGALHSSGHLTTLTKAKLHLNSQSQSRAIFNGWRKKKKDGTADSSKCGTIVLSVLPAGLHNNQLV